MMQHPGRETVIFPILPIPPIFSHAALYMTPRINRRPGRPPPFWSCCWRLYGWAAADSSPPPPPASGLPTQAQAKLTTMKLWLGAKEIIAELALTPLEQETGMMFRTNMEANAGMLFPLPYAQQASFWMTNCPLPLSAAYIDTSGVIQEIHDLRANDNNPVKSAAENIRFVLETPQGWFSRHNIREGTLVRTERGSLMKTFFQ